ncbi:hypothetical protein MM236_01975 [Belliella sp. DSM 107340]|uniref:Uncharacterized protein n=1 Tax=Belliella calami TaxID=2923436 RepID=A0ABS9UJE5_9BACT|nr:hypothetical protein [Belliella calami]MCH7396731.1 hypothetical protein [Belliella calami]
MMDWSKFPSRIIDGQTEYYFNGVWVRPIDIDNISPQDLYYLDKTPNYYDSTKYTYLASRDAMIKGCYKIVKVEEVEKEIAADNPGRFIATANYKKNPNLNYEDKEGRVALVKVRINPLLNRNSEGDFMNQFKNNDSFPLKTLKNFQHLFLNKEIHLEEIRLVENKEYNNSSYVYKWNYI